MKKTMKKLLAVVLAVAMIFSVSTMAFAFESIDFTGYEDYINIFPDVAEGTWYYDPITYCSACYITGYKDGKFGPGDNLQRQDFAIMILRFNWQSEWEEASEYFGDVANKDDFNQYKEFSDVPVGQYYTGAINYCYNWGIITGYQNGKFGVGDKITREQVVTMLFRNSYEDEEEFWEDEGIAEEDRDEVVASVLSDFPDADKVSDFAKVPMAWAIAYGIITGKNGNIAPQDNITRAEVAMILTRVDLDFYGWSILEYLNGEYND